MKLILSPHDLSAYWREVCHHIVKGFGMLLAAILLTLTSLFGWIYKSAVSLITRHPKASVIAVFISMSLVTTLVYARMKARVTSAEWKADSLSLSLDSLKEYTHTGNYEYSRLTR